MDFNTQVRGYFGLERCGRCDGRSYDHYKEDEKVWQYLIVPLKGDRIEIPAFALSKFNDILAEENLPDEMAILLHSKGYKTYYKSFAKIMEISLLERFSSKLVKLEGKDGNKTNIYYTTQGAVFDKDFKPLVMCTWILENMEYKEQNVFNPLITVNKKKWFFKYPVLRIDPQFYLSKPDNVGRFINKKVVNELLQDTISSPIVSYNNQKIGNSYGSQLKPKVEIGECPFKVRSTYRPSITVTNDMLKQVVLDNMEDFT